MRVAASILLETKTSGCGNYSNDERELALLERSAALLLETINDLELLIEQLETLFLLIGTEGFDHA